MSPRRLLLLLLPLVLLGAVPPLVPRAAHAAEPVVAAGALLVPRAEHSATLLADGRVLVAGGYRGQPTNTGLQTLDAAEIYDPITDRWTAAAPLLAPRQRHTATLLRDGRVLVVGGAGPGARLLTATASAEIYDPVANRWTPTGPLHAPRWLHQAVPLPDGRVLVVGGRGLVFDERCGCDYASLATAEIYDPATGTWAVARPMGEPRFGHAATALQDGRVLVVGGRNRDSSRELQSAEIYDPATDRWLATARAEGFIASPAATLLPDGEVLITGDDEALRYDSRADRWTGAGSSPRGYRLRHTATALPGGAVLVVGGREGVATAERYDPIAETWTEAGAVPGAMLDHTATALHDGRVLIAGGKASLPDAPTAAAWLATDPAPPACFAETGFCVGGAFLDGWRARGGLALNGYPLGPVRSETLDGVEYRVQYFERSRMEWHLESADPAYRVQLGQFGRRIRPAEPAVPALPGAVYDPVTGHNVARPAFAAFYAAHGGLAQFGRPIGEETDETLPNARGEPTSFRVQYFERARLEWHPENAPDQQVQLGQFGRRILADQPVAPTYQLILTLSDPAPPRGATITLSADIGRDLRPLPAYQLEATWRGPDGDRICRATGTDGHAACALPLGATPIDTVVRVDVVVTLPDGTRLRSAVTFTVAR